MKAVFFGTFLGLIIFSGTALANTTEVDIDCQKLAKNYFQTPNSLLEKEIEQLKTCLEQRKELQPPKAPKNLQIQSQSSLTENPETTPPQPPKNLRVQ